MPRWILNCKVIFIEVKIPLLFFLAKLTSGFLTELNSKFDLITISETWSNTQTVDGYDLKGYDVYHKVRNNRKGGGVAWRRRGSAVECRTLERESPGSNPLHMMAPLMATRCGNNKQTNKSL